MSKDRSPSDFELEPKFTILPVDESRVSIVLFGSISSWAFATSKEIALAAGVEILESSMRPFEVNFLP